MKFNFGKIVNWANLEFVIGTPVWLPYSFPNRIFLRLVEQEKEYMKQNRGMNIMKIVDKVVENLTRGRWIPMTLWRVAIILKILVIGLGVWVILSQIISIWLIWLVHVVYSRVGVIWVKWDQSEIWIHIRIEKLLLKSISQFTKKKNKQTNKQLRKKKKKTSIC